jgi:hypothetical protein
MTYIVRRGKCCVCADNKLVEFTEISDKRAETIAIALLKLLEVMKITRIVSDTEPTITGARNGVIAIIRRHYPKIIYEPCRFHILDLIIRNQIDFFLGKPRSTSPQIPYDFIQNIKSNWLILRKEYMETERLQPAPCSDLPNAENRRDDYRFLLELCKALITFRERGDKPFIKIPFRPVNISLARWNSKAIYCLMSELIAGNDDLDMQHLNNFIAYEWAPVWFRVRQIVDWTKLRNMCQKSKSILEKHGLINKVDDKSYTNEVAERIFRSANEKILRFKSVNDLKNAMLRYFNISKKLNSR